MDPDATGPAGGTVVVDAINGILVKNYSNKHETCHTRGGYPYESASRIVRHVIEHTLRQGPMPMYLVKHTLPTLWR
jgi:hypothetical protein